MSWLAAIGAFLGNFFKAILPELFAQAKKPRDVKVLGADKELQDDINSSIEDENE